MNEYSADKMYIGGQWRSTPEKRDVFDPSTGVKMCEISLAGPRDVDEAVQAARAAFEGEWGDYTAAERGRVLMKMSALVLKQAPELAKMEAQDVGKPFSQAKADVVALARYLEFYGGAADKIHGETIPYLNGYTIYTLREPFGVTAHIIPWNYPMQIMGRSVAAALAMGNACVVKPAEDTCLSALEFARISEAAGLPRGALNIVTGLGEVAGAALSAHPDVNHISFTGSVCVGEAVQSSAAKNTVPVTLELGGKSPQIVFADADIDKALPFLINSGIQNAGQTCSAGSRILVEHSVYEQVLQRLKQAYSQLKVGPALEDYHVGPLVSAKQRDRVISFMDEAKADGLDCVARGQIVEDAPTGGFYVEPSLWAGVDPQHVLAQQEVFGPLQVVIPFTDEEQAIEIANGTDFGLVAGVWSENGARQMRLAKALNCGQVFINNYGAGGGVELPFGGVGRSGHGREKGFEALYGFSTLKTVAASHG
ncbi:MAG TPA: aldehyde dehydrogenase family protein [Hellea balneolensis]|uniref:Aldehyde dehydrogenase family protein n=1 Tax=Hellea balneolensis TaxID=287478 RepID=A0A7C5R0J6_9PROT|nr:aldehyde dehydrogenase family protein [Hellea balneolensis]